MNRIARIAILALASILALAPAVPGHAGIPPIAAQSVVPNLTWPAAFTFTSRGNIFFGNRLTGAIKVFNQNTTKIHTFFKIPGVVSDNEQGLLGIAVDPDYPSTPFVYAYATRLVNGVLHNQIVRIRALDQTGVSWRVIFTVKTVATAYHNGGRILFGPDGKLYAIVGDAHNSANSQTLSNNSGKILRMTSAGKVPGGNAWGGRIFTTGVRNSFGFTFDPATGDLWETENGPECNDEINQFSNGDNGGWGPNETCDGTVEGTNQDGANPVLPLQWYTPTIAPTGAVFCPASGCGLPAGTEGDLFFGSFNDSNIHEADPADVPGTDTIALSWSSGILSMERNPATGSLFFSDPGGIFELVTGTGSASRGPTGA
jgi:glucose/arabinose dehydrogenase